VRLVAISIALAACGKPHPAPAKVVTPEGPRQVPATTQKGADATGVNRAVDACTDFYEYANGTWRANNPIPAGKPKWGRRDVAKEANKQKLRTVIQDAAAKTDWPAESAAQIVGDFYASCIDETALEAAGLAPIAPLLAEIDAVKTRDDIGRVIRRLHDLGIAAPFGVTGAFDNTQPTIFQLNLVAGSLGLDRDAYAKKDLVGAYRQRVARVFSLAKIPEKSADDVIAFETRFATASLDANTAADPKATEHKTTFAELEKLAPRFDWGKYFASAEIPRGAVNVAEPKLLQQIDKDLATAPVAAWKTYLKWKLLETASPWLSKQFSPTDAPRAQRCVDLTEALLPEPVGRIYADKHFPQAAKAKAREIANNLLAVMKRDVAALPWLAADTKYKALEKLATMNIQLGYPDVWKDVSVLQIRRDALWANIAQARRLAVYDMRREIGTPTDRSRWQLPPSSAAAYLEAQLNQLVLPAGFLQPPYFDPAATDAMNYGALGAGLAHDMTHAFDATGSILDAQGRAQTWWTDADRQAFQKRAQCIVDQYEGYEIEPGVHHQGKLVLDEALGDQAGLHFAYLAFKAAGPGPTIDGFTPEQQFFLAWGQFRGEGMSLEAQRNLVKGDSHPVPKFRVNGPMSMLPAFADAFACKADAPMVRSQRCVVW
jgi:putative endopeptidase